MKDRIFTPGGSVWVKGIIAGAIAAKVSSRGHSLASGKGLTLKSPKGFFIALQRMHDVMLEFIVVKFSPIRHAKAATYHYFWQGKEGCYTNLRFLCDQSYVDRDKAVNAMKRIAASLSFPMRILPLVSYQDGKGQEVHLLFWHDYGSFEDSIFYWYLRMPRYISHQFVRHRAFTIVQESLRRTKAKSVYRYGKEIDGILENMLKEYSKFASQLELEVARAILPIATLTTIVVMTPGWALKNYLALRRCLKAQQEHVWLANHMALAVKKVAPQYASSIPRCRYDLYGFCPEDDFTCPILKAKAKQGK